MTIMDEKTRTSLNPAHYSTIGKVAVEKLESIRSKMLDNTTTEEDRLLGRMLEEITAIAKNRISVTANESDFSKGSDVWVERTEGHIPHIRLHGGALEDDPIG